MRRNRPNIRRYALVAAFLIAASVLRSAEAVDTGEALTEDTQLTSAALEEPSRTLPSWLKIGAEFRSRLQTTHGIGFQPGVSETCWMNRLRVDLGLQPYQWLQFRVQAHSAHAPGLSGVHDGSAENVDFRPAVVEVGQREGTGWFAQLGRQELSFGDERLIGSDSYWDPLGPTFNALRLAWNGSRIRIEGFTAVPVEASYHGFNHGTSGNRLHGIYASLKPTASELVVEPFAFWKSDKHVDDGMLSRDAANIYTYGIRSAGPLGTRSDYNIEMALQRGRRAGEPIRAWAGHWEAGYRLFNEDRLAIEYNFGSGDSDQNDRHHGAFDDLYAAAYDGFGIVDPIPWINMRSVGANWETPLTKTWVLHAGGRSLWLATTSDGLYLDAETWLAHGAEPVSGYVGKQVALQLKYQSSQHWEVWMAITRLMPGTYLLASHLAGHLTTPYITWTYRF